ncbi:MAG: putative toxin-antitoxin system toxin component, PIN family, partial [Gammaproteobacteria bacterium]
TNTLVSALLFRGSSSYLVQLWLERKITPLVCRETVDEFLRVLNYPKFKLSTLQIEAVAEKYLRYAWQMTLENNALPADFPQCRDSKDQIFVELAYFGKADVLISGDADLLILGEIVPFAIETPAHFKLRYLK